MDLEPEHQPGLRASPGGGIRGRVDQGCFPAAQARRGLCAGIPDAAIQGAVLSTEVSDPDPVELREWALGSIPAPPVATTVGGGCILGVALTSAADDVHLREVYGVFAAGARDVDPG